MIVKSREMPNKIKKIEALLKRLPPHHEKRPILEEHLVKSIAGYRGEKSLDYYLQFLEKETFSIFQDLRLKDKNFFQIDTLIISPHFIVILEVKNIAGTLFFDQSFNQFIRYNNEKEEVLPNPILQVSRQELQFVNWLKVNKLPQVPVESFVVFANPYSQLKTNAIDSEIYRKVSHCENIISKISFLEKTFKKVFLEKKDTKKLTKLLLKNNKVQEYNIFNEFSIGIDEVQKGVQCPGCSAIPMNREWKVWKCSFCGHSSTDAHLESLQDYFLLFQPTITNKQFRDFFFIKSSVTANRLLTSAGLECKGKTKDRKYFNSSQI
ncbi:NERD domain-containing protein [Bacillus timonensis]|nr:NERD domain-containing protein [Bacillus timonensis]